MSAGNKKMVYSIYSQLTRLAGVASYTYTPKPPRLCYCKNCGSEYVTKGGNYKFCSLKCRLIVHRQRFRKGGECFKSKVKPKEVLSKECLHCNVVFQTTSKRQVLCTIDCRLKRNCAIRKDRRVKKALNNHTCEECGGAYLSKMIISKFCSENCRINNRHRTISDVYIRRLLSKRHIYNPSSSIIQSERALIIQRRHKYQERINGLCTRCGARIVKGVNSVRNKNCRNGIEGVCSHCMLFNQAKNLLKRTLKLTSSEIPTQLIELKRSHLKLNRALYEIKER